MKGSMLKFIETVRNANSEEDVTSLLEIMNPTDDSDEMGQKYNEVLGYNPITYFDEVKVRKIIDAVSERYPNVDLNIDLLLNEINEEVEVVRERVIIKHVYTALTEELRDTDENIYAIVKNIIAEKLNREEDYISYIIDEFDIDTDEEVDYYDTDEEVDYYDTDEEVDEDE